MEHTGFSPNPTQHSSSPETSGYETPEPAGKTLRSGPASLLVRVPKSSSAAVPAACVVKAAPRPRPSSREQRDSDNDSVSEISSMSVTSSQMLSRHDRAERKRERAQVQQDMARARLDELDAEEELEAAMAGSGFQNVTTPRSSRRQSPRGSAGCLSPGIENIDSGNSNLNVRNVQQQTIDHGRQVGNRLSDEFQSIIAPTSCPTLSRVLPSLPEGENLVESEVTTTWDHRLGGDRLSDEFQPVTFPVPSQNPQSLGA